MLVCGCLFAFGAALLLMDFMQSRTPLEEGLLRNPFGEGSREETLDVEAGDNERASVTVEVSPQDYTQEELQSLFRRCTKKLDRLILGENESADHVESDLNLLTAIPDTPVEVRWELSRYDVMTVTGELQEGALQEEGTLVELTGILSLEEEPDEQAVYNCTVAVYPKTLGKKDQLLAKIQEALKKKDEETKQKDYLELPAAAGGETLSFYLPMQERGAVLILLAALVGVLLLALEKQKESEKQKEKKKQMQLDYPEIVGKLALLLGAGMTVKRAWKKTAADYQAGKERSGMRFAYEEMVQSCHEMESGVTEAASYEHFGKRCAGQEYIRLGALLSQNLRKGTKGISEMLKTEAGQAFEERKARAKRLGEEAGTKLLGPMFFMLAVVLVIVVVPAFLSIQL